MAFYDGPLCLENIEMPLYGNRASYCAAEIMFWDLPISTYLKRVSVNITRPMPTALLDSMGYRVGVEYLDLTLSHSAHDKWSWSGSHLPPSTPLLLIDPHITRARQEYASLTELRLMFDNHYSITENELMSVILLAPKLERLALGHFKLQQGTWSSFLRRLSRSSLKRLWLLNPVQIVMIPFVHLPLAHDRVIRAADRKWWTELGGIDNMFKYAEDANLYSAADEGRLIDTQTDWDPREEPKRSRTFEHPGFGIFEQTES